MGRAEPRQVQQGLLIIMIIMIIIVVGPRDRPDAVEVVVGAVLLRGHGLGVGEEPQDAHVIVPRGGAEGARVGREPQPQQHRDVPDAALGGRELQEPDVALLRHREPRAGLDQHPQRRRGLAVLHGRDEGAEAHHARRRRDLKRVQGRLEHVVEQHHHGHEVAPHREHEGARALVVGGVEHALQHAGVLSLAAGGPLVQVPHDRERIDRDREEKGRGAVRIGHKRIRAGLLDEPPDARRGAPGDGRMQHGAAVGALGRIDLCAEAHELLHAVDVILRRKRAREARERRDKARVILDIDEKWEMMMAR